MGSGPPLLDIYSPGRRGGLAPRSCRSFALPKHHWVPKMNSSDASRQLMESNIIAATVDAIIEGTRWLATRSHASVPTEDWHAGFRSLYRWELDATCQEDTPVKTYSCATQQRVEPKTLIVV